LEEFAGILTGYNPICGMKYFRGLADDRSCNFENRPRTGRELGLTRF